jgi:uncharacterized protein (DUF1697 family)
MLYVVFLRAINVAGHARVSMRDVQSAFTKAGCENVRTFIQSGNLVFESSPRRLPVLLRAIDKTLGTLLREEPQLLVGVTATSRNWSTVTKILEFARTTAGSLLSSAPGRRYRSVR